LSKKWKGGTDGGERKLGDQEMVFFIYYEAKGSDQIDDAKNELGGKKRYNREGAEEKKKSAEETELSDRG